MRKKWNVTWNHGWNFLKIRIKVYLIDSHNVDFRPSRSIRIDCIQRDFTQSRYLYNRDVTNCSSCSVTSGHLSRDILTRRFSRNSGKKTFGLSSIFSIFMICKRSSVNVWRSGRINIGRVGKASSKRASSTWTRAARDTWYALSRPIGWQQQSRDIRALIVSATSRYSKYNYVNHIRPIINLPPRAQSQQPSVATDFQANAPRFGYLCLIINKRTNYFEIAITRRFRGRPTLGERLALVQVAWRRSW